MAELADAPDLGSGVIDVGVQVPLSAPDNRICGSGSVVERCLAKADIAGPNPVSRSIARTICPSNFIYCMSDPRGSRDPRIPSFTKKQVFLTKNACFSLFFSDF